MLKRIATEVVIAVISLWGCVASPLPQAAVLSDDAGSMANETDLLEGFGRIEKYHMKDFARLSRELNQYEIVILTSVANYTAKLDFNTEREAWSRYVADGGILLVFDANYTETSDRVIAPFVDRPLPFQWSPCQVSSEAYSDGGVAAGWEKRLSEPADLTGYFPKLRSWQHFQNLPPEWHTLVHCKHGQPLIVERDYGQGEIIVSTYYGLFSIVGKQFIRDLVRDLTWHNSWRRAGLELTANEVVFNGNAAHWQGAIRAAASPRPRLTARLEDAAGNVLAQAELAFAADGIATIDLTASALSGDVQTVIAPEDSGIRAYRRTQAPPDTTVKWHLPARLQPGQLSRIRIPLRNVGERRCAEAAIRVDGTLYLAQVAPGPVLQSDFSGLASGEHQAVLVLDGEESAPQQFTVTTPQMHLAIDADGWLSRDGKPFFPIGLYHVSRAAGVDAANRLACLDFAARNGYNLILMATIGDAEDDRFMAEAEQRGIALFCDVKTMDTIAAKRNQWPAVVSWMHELDEPEHWGYCRDDVLKRADAIYRLDPKSVVFSSMETTSTIVSYSGAVDLMATSGYPIPHNPLRLVFDKMKLLTAAAEQYMFVPLATIQSFGYPRPEDKAGGYPGLPTPQEIRNMTWQALLNNVRGINYYTYADGAFRLEEYPELHCCMEHMPEEINLAVPFLRGNDFTRLATGDPDIEGGTWKLPGRVLTVYVNLANATRKLRLPQPATGMVPHFGSRPPSAAIEVELAPYETVIWTGESR